MPDKNKQQRVWQKAWPFLLRSIKSLSFLISGGDTTNTVMDPGFAFPGHRKIIYLVV